VRRGRKKAQGKKITSLERKKNSRVIRTFRETPEVARRGTINQSFGGVIYGKGIKGKKRSRSKREARREKRDRLLDFPRKNYGKKGQGNPRKVLLLYCGGTGKKRQSSDENWGGDTMKACTGTQVWAIWIRTLEKKKTTSSSSGNCSEKGGGPPKVRGLLPGKHPERVNGLRENTGGSRRAIRTIDPERGGMIFIAECGCKICFEGGGINVWKSTKKGEKSALRRNGRKLYG